MSKNTKKNLNGIGGWLLFFAIGRFFSCLREISDIAFNAAFSLTTVWGLVFTFVCILDIMCFVLLVRKDILFRLIFLLSAGIYVMLCLFAGDASAILMLLSAGIWGYYLFNSKRVAITFGLPLPDIDGGGASGAKKTPSAKNSVENSNKRVLDKGLPNTPPSPDAPGEAPAGGEKPARTARTRLLILLGIALAITLALGLFARVAGLHMPEEETAVPQSTGVLFRNAQWGMTPEEVWAAEGRQPDKSVREGEGDDLDWSDQYFDVDLEGHTWDLGYQYGSDNTLRLASYTMYSSDLMELMQVYYTFDGGLTARFGEPVFSEINQDGYIQFSAYDDVDSVYMIGVMPEDPKTGRPYCLLLGQMPYE